MKIAYSKDGTLIIGSYDTIPGVAMGRVVLDHDEIRVSHVGDTEVFWDEQRVATNDRGERLYVDEKYNVIAESELVFRDETESDPL